MSVSSSSTSTKSTPRKTQKQQKHQLFPLAYPPPKSAQRLRLHPKLLLQIQHLSHATNRPIPVLEVWQPSIFTGRFPGFPKLRSGDFYITQSEGFDNLTRGKKRTSDGAEGEGEGDGEGLVGVVCRGENGADLYFSSGAVWGARNTDQGYRFEIKDGNEKVFEWRKEKEKVVLCVEGEDGQIAEMSRKSIDVRGGDDLVRILGFGVYVASQEGWFV